MIPLKQIHVPTPCHEAWEAMEGDAQTRFCAGCRKHVHNLSEMSRGEAEALLARTDGELCVRFQPTAAGAPQTREDVRRAARLMPWRRRLAAALSAVLLGGLNAGCGTTTLPPGLRAFVARLSPIPPAPTTGSIAVFPPPVPVATIGGPAPTSTKARPKTSAAPHAARPAPQSHPHKGVPR